MNNVICLKQGTILKTVKMKLSIKIATVKPDLLWSAYR